MAYYIVISYFCSGCFGNIIIHIKEGFIFVDCSIVDIGLAAKYDKCRIQVIKNNNIPETARTKVRDYNIVGYTCLENDILKKSFTGTIAIGDTIVFKGCGAYSYCWANDFIKPKLNVLSK
ncbi:MAG: hypothetical protein K6F69_01865 [Treponema sp.]|nr:hypothetical protein [Treponema sp.]